MIFVYGPQVEDARNLLQAFGLKVPIAPLWRADQLKPVTQKITGSGARTTIAYSVLNVANHPQQIPPEMLNRIVECGCIVMLISDANVARALAAQARSKSENAS